MSDRPDTRSRAPLSPRTHAGSRRGVWLAILIALAALLAACGGDGDEADGDVDGGTGNSSGSSLREIDFTEVSLAAELIDRAGGGDIVPERIHYEDFDRDGTEEAVVIVESGGTVGDLGAGIYRLVEDRPQLVYFAQSGGRVEVRVGVVIFQSGIWAADDAACCPSQLREIGVGWDGSAFTELSDQVVDNPQR